MIPLRDSNPSINRPYVTIGIIAANVGVFIYMLTLNDYDALVFTYRYGLIPWEVLNGRPIPELSAAGIEKNVFLSVFTCMFVHSGWLHIGGNLLFLWIFGNNVEDAYGHAGFLVFYLMCGLGASAMQIAVSWNSEIPMVGASGAIAGVLGAYILLFPRSRILSLVFIVVFVTIIELPAFVLIGIWIALQFFSGVTSIHSLDQGGVAWFAHIGGIIAGFLITLLLYSYLRKRIESQRPPFESSIYDAFN